MLYRLQLLLCEETHAHRIGLDETQGTHFVGPPFLACWFQYSSTFFACRTPKRRITLLIMCRSYLYADMDHRGNQHELQPVRNQQQLLQTHHTFFSALSRCLSSSESLPSELLSRSRFRDLSFLDFFSFLCFLLLLSFPMLLACDVAAATVQSCPAASRTKT